MTLYGESSAVLAWLLGEPASNSVGGLLGASETVFISELTILECDRALVRAVALRELSQDAAGIIQARLGQSAAHWQVWRLTPEIVERARLPFPSEPVRTLDALHLATALAARSAVPGVELLSLNERIRRSGSQLGFKLQPR